MRQAGKVMKFEECIHFIFWNDLLIFMHEEMFFILWHFFYFSIYSSKVILRVKCECWDVNKDSISGDYLSSGF